MSQKSEIVHYFSLQISDVHTFFVTSQLLKQEKRAAFFFNQRQLPKACWFWTIVKQKNVSLSCTTTLLSWQKEKKLLTSFVCFLLSSFWKKKQIWKRQKQNSAVLFLKASVLCFVFWPWANFALNKMSRVLSFKSKLCKERLCFSFSLCKPNELTLAFATRSFQKSSFCFLDKVYLAQIF